MRDDPGALPTTLMQVSAIRLANACMPHYVLDSTGSQYLKPHNCVQILTAYLEHIISS